ncbi:hypothetical protein QJS10_CPA01g00727 [Acorus calamus]|uniref:Myb-like domain-containing protein n=1 Tax=Acorus calamus TaxID=4465 RepID=A0AAV9FM61_ACOCL|nr:hypothetical protein QJS10_CPA01g00727 [Acorus calamus]
MGRGRGRGRAPCCEKVGLKKGSWTRAEDMKLVVYIQQHGHANWRALPKQAENSNQHKEILNSEQLNMDSLDMLDELSIMESEEIMSSLSSPSGTIDGAKTIPVEPDFDIWDMFDHDTLLPPPESSITTSSSSSSSSASPNTKSIDHCSSKEVQNIHGRHDQEPVFIDYINQTPFDLDLDVVGDVFDNDDAWLAMGDTTTVGEVEISGGGERGDHNWIADLERELGLWGSSDGDDQFEQQQNVQIMKTNNVNVWGAMNSVTGSVCK